MCSGFYSSMAQGFIEYKNFELGVLFHSGLRHQGARGAGNPGESGGRTVSTSYVQYKAYNRACKVHSHPILGPARAGQQHYGMSGNTFSSQDEIIVLPVPFDICASMPYCDSNGFLREPYFHDKSEVLVLVGEEVFHVLYSPLSASSHF